MPQIRSIFGLLIYYVLSYITAMVILAFAFATINECAHFALSLWRAGAANMRLRSHRAWVLLMCACYLGVKFIWRIFTWEQREDVAAAE